MTTLRATYENRMGYYTPRGLIRSRDRPLRIRVGVVDARRDCGKLRLLITPISGTGEAWVNAEHVQLDERTGTHG